MHLYTTDTLEYYADKFSIISNRINVSESVNQKRTVNILGTLNYLWFQIKTSSSVKINFLIKQKYQFTIVSYRSIGVPEIDPSLTEADSYDTIHRLAVSFCFDGYRFVSLEFIALHDLCNNECPKRSGLLLERKQNHYQNKISFHN